MPDDDKSDIKTLKSQTRDVEPYGRLHKGAFFLRQEAGAAEDDDGNKYEMSVNMAGATPMIMSQQTGYVFALSWKEILKMAIAAGIDDENAFADE